MRRALEITPERLTWIRNALWVAFALTAIALGLAWRDFVRQRPGRVTTIALGILTVSYVWILALLAAAPIVAPDYSDLRSHTIDLNSIAALVAIILVFIGRRMRKQLLPAGFGLLILWLYIGLVSSVV